MKILVFEIFEKGYILTPFSDGMDAKNVNLNDIILFIKIQLISAAL